MGARATDSYAWLRGMDKILALISDNSNEVLYAVA